LLVLKRKVGEEIVIAGPCRITIVDIARGAAPGDLNSAFSDLNKKWAQGIATAGA